ncbi:MAG: magnesium transporter CorA family protein, partial [Selenomonas sp.]|nr:magnesium transporter CorA family protein [Selenomonas sp.]
TLTIAMAVPTIVFSLWGTNVPLPFQDDPEGFYEVIGVALVFSIIAIIGMWKKDLF